MCSLFKSCLLRRSFSICGTLLRQFVSAVLFFLPMACRARRLNFFLLWLSLFFIASCNCTRLTKLKELDKLRGYSALSHGQAEGGELRHGRLLIGQNPLQGAKLKGTKATKNLLDADTDYQADMGKLSKYF